MKKNNSNIWTENELKLLQNCCNSKLQSGKEISKIITSRSSTSITTKALKLGLSIKIRKFKKWNKEDIQKIKQYIESGMYHKDVANLFNVTSTTISILSHRHGFKSPRFISSEQELNIINMFKLGNSKRDILQKFNIPIRTLYNILERNNILSLRKVKELERNNFICKYKGNEILAKFIFKKFNQCKFGAQKRNIPFLITPEDLIELYIKQNGICYYSGILLSLETKNSRLDNPYKVSVDRIDSKDSYNKNNIVLCCDYVNLMKFDKNKDFFIKMCKIISNWNK